MEPWAPGGPRGLLSRSASAFPSLPALLRRAFGLVDDSQSPARAFLTAVPIPATTAEKAFPKDHGSGDTLEPWGPRIDGDGSADARVTPEGRSSPLRPCRQALGAGSFRVVGTDSPVRRRVTQPPWSPPRQSSRPKLSSSHPRLRNAHLEQLPPPPSPAAGPDYCRYAGLGPCGGWGGWGGALHPVTGV